MLLWDGLRVSCYRLQLVAVGQFRNSQNEVKSESHPASVNSRLLCSSIRADDLHGGIDCGVGILSHVCFDVLGWRIAGGSGST